MSWSPYFKHAQSTYTIFLSLQEKEELKELILWTQLTNAKALYIQKRYQFSLKMGGGGNSYMYNWLKKNHIDREKVHVSRASKIGVEVPNANSIFFFKIATNWYGIFSQSHGYNYFYLILYEKRDTQFEIEKELYQFPNTSMYIP